MWLRTALAFGFLTFGTATYAEDARYNLGCAPGPCAAPTWKTEDRDTVFRKAGWSLERWGRRMGGVEKLRYRTALRFWSSAESCLRRDAFTEDGADLARIDWERLDTALAAEVCLFRIHSALPTPEMSEMWFGLQGYDTRLDTPNNPGHFRYGHHTIFATWRQDPRDAPVKAWHPVFGRMVYGLAIRRNPEGDVTAINLSLSFK